MLQNRSFFQKITSGMLALCLMLLLALALPFGGGQPVEAGAMLNGDGSRDNPYRITSLGDLVEFQESVAAGKNYSGLYVVQTADIDLSKLSNFRTISTEAAPFWGTYDGQGHSLIGLTMSVSVFEANAALFEYLGGIVKNLGISGGTIRGAKAASFAITSSASAQIVNCWSTASLVGQKLSGIAYDFSGTVANVWHTSDETVPLFASGCEKAYYCYGRSIAPDTTQGTYTNCKLISSAYLASADFAKLLNLGREVFLNNNLLKESELVGWKIGPAFDTEYAPTWEGEGTRNDPYLISDAEELVRLSVMVNAGEEYRSTYFQLTDDIDLSDVYNLVPIGIYASTYYFFGTLDGAAHMLSNLNVANYGLSYNNGLFGQLGGTVKNLGIASGRIQGANCGSIASHAVDINALIMNCYSRASLVGSSRGGGIVDNFCGKVWNCVYDNPNQTHILFCSYSAYEIRNSYTTCGTYDKNHYQSRDDTTDAYSDVTKLTEYSDYAAVLEDLNTFAVDYARSYRESYNKYAEWTVDDSGRLCFRGLFDPENLPSGTKDFIDKYFTDQLVVVKLVLCSSVLLILTLVVDYLIKHRKRRGE